MAENRPGLLLGWGEKAFGYFKQASLLRLVQRFRQGDAVVDVYVISWLALEVIALALTAIFSKSPGDAGVLWLVLLGVIFGYRLADILQAVGNVVVFDALREGAKPAASPQRSLLLGFVNYVEIVVIFALAVYVVGDEFARPVGHLWDAVYSSLRQSALLGAPMEPVTRLAYFVSVVQVAMSILVLLTLLAWVIGSLPRRTDREGRERK